MPPVARLRSIAPFASGPFVVRGLVPCPYTWSEVPNALDHLFARLPGGTQFPTQVEGARYDERGRIEAIEVSAFVPPEASFTAGAPIAFDLEVGPKTAPAAPPPGQLAEYLRERGLSIHAAILDSAGTHWSYSAQILPNSTAHRIFRHGPLVQTLEFYGRLRPSNPGAPFSELLGFSLWLTWTAGEDIVEARLVLDSGRIRPALPDLDLVALEVQVPSGFEIEHKGPELESRPAVDLGTTWAHPLNALSRREVWIQRQERGWSFALFGTGNRTRARALLDNAGFAVPEPGVGWSWGDRALCGFLAQGLPVPDLRHLGVDTSVPGSAASLGTLLAKLQSGAPIGSSNNSFPRMGLFHPWGPEYGGVTGGSEIDQFEGVECAIAPDPRRLLEYQLRALRCLDRQRIALYDDSSRPLPMDSVEMPNGSLPFSIFNGLVNSNTDAPLGFKQAASSWTRPTGGPAYEATLRSFQPVDFQHLVRFTGPWKVLAALDRDPHAIRVLSLEAELVRAQMWEKTGGALHGWVAQCTARPRQGGPLGRGQGWSADVVSQAWIYRFNAWRKRFRGWAASFLEVVANSPTPAGVWQREESGKAIQKAPFNSQHSTAQTIELGILANGALGLWRASKAAHPTANVERALVEAGSTGLRYLWRVGSPSSYQFVAISPIAAGSPPYATLPTGLWSGYDSTQVENLLGHVLELATLSGDQATLGIVHGIVADWTSQAASPLTWLKGRGWANYYNRVAILSALEAGF
jgi:hypothetical protein